MLAALITLVVYLIIAGVIWWGVNAIIALLPIPDPIKSVINVVMIVILVILVIFALFDLLGALGVAGGGHHRLLR